MEDTKLPQDAYSQRLRELRGHPEAIEKHARVERFDFYGNVETWNVKTISYDGHATVFIERGTAAGGDRWLLPAEVVAALYRHRDGIAIVRVKRGARKGAATRKATGVQPFAKKTATGDR